MAKIGRFIARALVALGKLFLFCLLLGFIGGVVAAGTGYYYWDEWVANPPIGEELPNVEDLGKGPPFQTIKVVCRDGVEIGQLGVEKRTVLADKDIPPVMKNALKAAEDANFENHPGVDATAILKAVYRHLRHPNQKAGGASTITQQVVKNWVLKDNEHSLKRKVREAWLSMQLEKRWTKSQIIGLYLNQVAFGNRRYGVQEASLYYFGHPAAQLTVGEAALLAALAKSENISSKPARWKERQSYVLDQMVKNGWAKQDEADKAKAEPIKLVRQVPPAGLAPEFMQVAKAEAEKHFGDRLDFAGGQIVMSCDTKLQTAIRAAVEAQMEFIDQKNGDKPRPEGSAIVIDNETGQVLAMVGGYHQGMLNDKGKVNSLNRVMYAQRQPGSTMKPFLYTAAFESDFPSDEVTNLTPSTTFVDEVKTYHIRGSKDWTPQNHEGSTGKPITLRQALAHSTNTVAAALAEKVSPDAIVAVAKRFGIKSELLRPLEAPPDKREAKLSLALGTSEVNLLELSLGYSVFPNRGKLVEPVFVLKIEGKDTAKPAPKAVITEAQAYQMTTLLESVVTEGTAIRAKGKLDAVIDGKRSKRSIAGKTGTTQGYTDAWFIGFSADVTCGVWVGYDQPASLGSYWEGAHAALPAWLEIMASALSDKPAKTFGNPPEGITVKQIGVTKKGEPINEYYLAGTEPTDPPDGGVTDGKEADGGPSETAPPEGETNDTPSKDTKEGAEEPPAETETTETPRGATDDPYGE